MKPPTNPVVRFFFNMRFVHIVLIRFFVDKEKLYNLIIDTYLVWNRSGITG
jgi:hypothetical protein